MGRGDDVTNTLYTPIMARTSSDLASLAQRSRDRRDARWVAEKSKGGLSRLAQWVSATKQQRPLLEKAWAQTDNKKHQDARKAEQEEQDRRSRVKSALRALGGK